MAHFLRGALRWLFHNSSSAAEAQQPAQTSAPHLEAAEQAEAQQGPSLDSEPHGSSLDALAAAAGRPSRATPSTSAATGLGVQQRSSLGPYSDFDGRTVVKRFGDGRLHHGAVRYLGEHEMPYCFLVTYEDGDQETYSLEEIMREHLLPPSKPSGAASARTPRNSRRSSLGAGRPPKASPASGRKRASGSRGRHSAGAAGSGEKGSQLAARRTTPTKRTRRKSDKS